MQLALAVNRIADGGLPIYDPVGYLDINTKLPHRRFCHRGVGRPAEPNDWLGSVG